MQGITDSIIKKGNFMTKHQTDWKQISYQKLRYRRAEIQNSHMMADANGVLLISDIIWKLYQVWT